MSALHEAAQLALEALEYGQHSLKQISEYQWESRGQLAMDALKAALEQPEPAQEPVAWRYKPMIGSPWSLSDDGYYISCKRDKSYIVEPLYTASQPQPEPAQKPAQEPVAWATEIIDALQAQYNTEMIQENDSGDALIRLDDAIAAVEDAEKHYTTPPKPEPEQKPVAWWMPQHLRHQGKSFTSWVKDGHEKPPIYFGWVPLGPIRAQRPPLTDEDIRDAVQEADLDWQAGWTLDEHEPNRFTTLVRAIERKVRGRVR